MQPRLPTSLKKEREMEPSQDLRTRLLLKIYLLKINI
jgi:hypothetical protein